MREWLNSSKYGLFILLLAACCLFALLSLNGCDVGEAVKVKVPLAVQQKTGAPPTVSLNEAPFVQDQYRQAVQEDAQAKQQALEKGQRDLTAKVAKVRRDLDEWLKEQEYTIASREGQAEADIALLTGQMEDLNRDFSRQLESLRATTDRANEAFDAAIVKGERTAEFFGSMLNTGLTAAKGAAEAGGLASIPGGGLGLAALTGLAGLFFPTPGTSRRVKQAEDHGYDLGRREALETANSGAAIAKGATVPPITTPVTPAP